MYQEVLSRWRTTGACVLQRGNFAVFAESAGLSGSRAELGLGEGAPSQGHFGAYLVEAAALGR